MLTALYLSLGGPVQIMNPLYKIEVAVKNNVGVMYYTFSLPPQTLFTEDGKMGKIVHEFTP